MKIIKMGMWETRRKWRKCRLNDIDADDRMMNDDDVDFRMYDRADEQWQIQGDQYGHAPTYTFSLWTVPPFNEDKKYFSLTFPNLCDNFVKNLVSEIPKCRQRILIVFSPILCSHRSAFQSSAIPKTNFVISPWPLREIILGFWITGEGSIDFGCILCIFRHL